MALVSAKRRHFLLVLEKEEHFLLDLEKGTPMHLDLAKGPHMKYWLEAEKKVRHFVSKSRDQFGAGLQN